MNLKNVQTSGKAAPGISPMTLVSMTLDKEAQYGPQLLFVFKAGETKEGKEILYKFWYALSKSFPDDRASLFLANLQEFIKVREVVDPEAYSYFEELKQNSPDFDNFDDSQVQQFQYNFIKKMVEDTIGQSVNVVRHYNKNGYLGIPSVKENDWSLPFGKNPIMGPNLRLQAPQQEAVATVEETDW